MKRKKMERKIKGTESKKRLNKQKKRRMLIVCMLACSYSDFFHLYMRVAKYTTHGQCDSLMTVSDVKFVFI